jgi:hypothetical protein
MEVDNEETPRRTAPVLAHPLSGPTLVLCLASLPLDCMAAAFRPEPGMLFGASAEVFSVGFALAAVACACLALWSSLRPMWNVIAGAALVLALVTLAGALTGNLPNVIGDPPDVEAEGGG